MSKALRIICIALTIGLAMTGCNDQPSYSFRNYAKEEIVPLINGNEDLFNELVRVLVEDDDFFEKGRRGKGNDAFLITPYDEQVNLLNAHGQQVIRDFFELKPYMISYDTTRKYIEITFIGNQEDAESYVFLYWIDKQDTQDVRDYLEYREQNNTISTVSLPEGWYLYYS